MQFANRQDMKLDNMELDPGHITLRRAPSVGLTGSVAVRQTVLAPTWNIIAGRAESGR